MGFKTLILDEGTLILPYGLKQNRIYKYVPQTDIRPAQAGPGPVFWREIFLKDKRNGASFKFQQFSTRFLSVS